MLTPDETTQLLRGGDPATQAGAQRARGLIFHVWPDLILRAHIDRSVTTIKADAAARTYGACGVTASSGRSIDSGIDQTHPHFAAAHRSPTRRSRACTATSPVLLAADGKTSDDPARADRPVRARHPRRRHHRRCRAAGPAARLLIATNEPTSGDLPSWVSRDPGARAAP